MSAREPFYSVPNRGEPSRGRLLLISPEFPPGGSAGALRWQKLARYAYDRGWVLDVITLDTSDLKTPDLDRLHELPPGTRVFGVKRGKLVIDRVEQWLWDMGHRLLEGIPGRSSGLSGDSRVEKSRSARPESLSREETRAARWTPRLLVRTYYAGLLLLRQLRWSWRATRVGRRLGADQRYYAVITCGPPHPTHIAGTTISRRLGIPHIVDMRDPWSLAERVPEVIATPVWYAAAQHLERRVLGACALVVCNTRPAQQALERMYPNLSARVMTVMNGYDDEPMPEMEHGSRFLLAYVGTIYLDRDPSPLFRAASRVVRERGLTPNQFGIEFMGNAASYSGRSLGELAAAEGLEGFVKVWPRRPRPDAMRFLAGASMLVSLPQDSHMAIPSKIFEYMRFDAWMLALAEPESATYQLLENSGADVVAPNDLDAMASLIGRRYDEHARGAAPKQPALLPGCSRAAQATLLFDAFDESPGFVHRAGSLTADSQHG